MFNGGLPYFFWYMFIIYLFVAVIWMFIRVFADIFHRENLTGWGKFGWILLIFIIPFIGLLIYVIARPKNTERISATWRQRKRRRHGWSAARTWTTSPRRKASWTRARSPRPSSTASRRRHSPRFVRRGAGRLSFGAGNHWV